MSIKKERTLGTTVFRSQALAGDLGEVLRARLARAHAAEPFSPIDPRRCARRVAALVAPLGLRSVVYRGGLDLRGVEVDHVWLAAGAGAGEFVLDTAFPLFDDGFVAALRRFVCGDGTRTDLDRAAAGSGVEDRVLGEIPAPMRYLGMPVWSSRS